MYLYAYAAVAYTVIHVCGYAISVLIGAVIHSAFFPLIKMRYGQGLPPSGREHAYNAYNALPVAAGTYRYTRQLLQLDSHRSHLRRPQEVQLHWNASHPPDLNESSWAAGLACMQEE